MTNSSKSDDHSNVTFRLFAYSLQEERNSKHAKMLPFFTGPMASNANQGNSTSPSMHQIRNYDLCSQPAIKGHWMSFRKLATLAVAASCSLALAGCLPGIGGSEIAAALKPLPAETQVLLAKKGMTEASPIFVRIFKEESQLEIWKEKSDGRYYHFKTYPICTWSGDLGPKIREGDKQSPEGFYTVTTGQMNPNSQFHLAFNLGYPNAFDKANGRTGSALMVHGDCRSAGCYAMTDALIEEIYAIAREAFKNGQTKFHVHAFPFRMTAANMKRHRKNKWYSFWKTLKPGYDDFELTRKTPEVYVCSKQYLVNAQFIEGASSISPVDSCPAYRRVPGKPFTPPSITAKSPASDAALSSSRIAAYRDKQTTTTGSATSQPSQTQVEGTGQIADGEETLTASTSGAKKQPGTKTATSEKNIHNVVQSGKSDLTGSGSAGD